jgi:hypothetical protein
MENKGKANIKVEYSRKELPFVQKNANFDNADFQSRSYDSQIVDSEYFMPTLIEPIVDIKSKIFTIIPQRRKVFIDNFLKGVEGTPEGEGVQYILWEPLDIYLNDSGWGLIKDMAADYPYTSTSNPDGTCNNEGDEGGAGAGPKSTKCSKWINASFPAVSLPDDESRVVDIQSYLENNDVDCGTGGTSEGDAEKEEDEEEEEGIPSLGYVNQTQALHGLFWGVESESFLESNMPFWLNIKRTAFSPSGDKYEGVLVISLGVQAGDDSSGGESQQFDLVLSENNKAELIDYWFGREAIESGETGGGGSGSGSDPSGTSDEESAVEPPPYSRKTFDNDKARVLREQKNIEIGFMTIAGRLVIFINGETLVYNRVDPTSGELAECKIAASPIRVYGTNHQTAINVSFMSFAELGAFSIIGPSVKKEDIAEGEGDGGGGGGEGDSPSFEAIQPDGTVGGTVAELPADPESTGGGEGAGGPTVFGVDCETFTDDSGSSNPEGFGFHKQGDICFKDVGSAESKNQDGKNYYIVTMKPSDTIAKEDSDSTTSGDPIPIPNGGCPYFFRLLGAVEEPKEPAPDWTDVSEDVISMSEKEGLDSDYTVGVKNGTVTLYNKDGRYDSLRGLQAAWRLYFSWCGDAPELVFTGLNVAATVSESPGNETITFQLKDYTEVLKASPILNSPIMDGMFSYSAIELLAKKVGVLNADFDWPDKKSYYLPSGQSIEAPSVKFEMGKSIYDSMVWIAQKDQSNFYFNEEGRLVIRKIPGGLFFDTGGLAPSAEFVRSPIDFEAGLGHLILDEKQEEFNIASTVTEVNIFGMRKDLKVPFAAKVVPADVMPRPPNVILFTKRLYMQQQALQGAKAAHKYALELGQRVFWPIKRISVKVAGFDGDGGTAPQVLDLVKVDGSKYRVKDIDRSYNAESNDFTITFALEWKGGAG